MGISGSSQKTKTRQTNRPVYGQQIMGAYNQQQDAYNRQVPKINETADGILGLSNQLLADYQAGNPMINAAEGYVTDTLNSDPQNNPYLDQMIAQSNDSVRNQMQAQMGTRGLTGSSDYYGMISKGLGQNELNMRYADYDQAMQRKAQAAGLSANVAAADLLNLAPAMGAAEMGAMLPLRASLANSSATGGLLGQYQSTNGTQTTSSNPGLMGIIGTGLQAASIFSTKLLKTDISPIGERGGVNWYNYRYVWDAPDTVREGVIAEEVMQTHPKAVHADAATGYLKVDYSALPA